MNNDPFKVFLQKQRDNQEINEIAALARVGGKIASAVGSRTKAAQSFSSRLAARASAKAATSAGVTGRGNKRIVTADPTFGRSGSAGAGKLGATRARVGTGTSSPVTSADPAMMKSPTGQLRRDRVALAQKLRDRGGSASLGMKLKSGAGKQLGKEVSAAKRMGAAAAPLAMKAVKGIGAFAKRGGFSSGFNQLYKDDITTGYRQAGGQLGGGVNRLVGVGTQAGDEADIEKKERDRENAAAFNRGEGAGGIKGPRGPRDPFSGLSPTERRNAMRYGAASGG